jgi:hypothetical protein
MATTRAHIVFEPGVLLQIDELVGPRERSSFVNETVAAELRRRKMMKLLENWEAVPDEAWDPELVRLGAAKWVRKLRAEESPRMKHIRKLQGARK